MDFLGDLLASISDIFDGLFGGSDGPAIHHGDPLHPHFSGDYDTGLVDAQGNHVMGSVHPWQPDYYSAETGKETSYWDTRKP